MPAPTSNEHIVKFTMVFIKRPIKKRHNIEIENKKIQYIKVKQSSYWNETL